MNISNQVTSRKSQEINISRKFASADEEHLLNVAEAVYPIRTEVLRATLNEIELHSRPVNDKNLWWCNSFDGVLIPYAITKGTIVYYLTLSDEFRRSDFRRTAGIRMSTSLNYTASIQHQESYQAEEAIFKDVYIVSIHFSWSQYCGNVCAMSFGKARTVIVDKNGNVLYVAGDECTVPNIS